MTAHNPIARPPSVALLAWRQTLRDLRAGELRLLAVAVMLAVAAVAAGGGLLMAAFVPDGPHLAPAARITRVPSGVSASIVCDTGAWSIAGSFMPRRVAVQTRRWKGGMRRSMRVPMWSRLQM